MIFRCCPERASASWVSTRIRHRRGRAGGASFAFRRAGVAGLRRGPPPHAVAIGLGLLDFPRHAASPNPPRIRHGPTPDLPWIGSGPIARRMPIVCLSRAASSAARALLMRTARAPVTSFARAPFERRSCAVHAPLMRRERDQFHPTFDVNDRPRVSQAAWLSSMCPR